jgi:hypothetical protein
MTVCIVYVQLNTTHGDTKKHGFVVRGQPRYSDTALLRLIESRK